MAAKQNFNWNLGEDWQILLTCYADAASTDVLDLTGAESIVFTMHQLYTDDDLIIDTATGIDVQDPATDGEVLITVTGDAQVAAGTRAGTHRYFVRVTDSSGFVSDQLEGVITAETP